MGTVSDLRLLDKSQRWFHLELNKILLYTELAPQNVAEFTRIQVDLVPPKKGRRIATRLDCGDL